MVGTTERILRTAMRMAGYGSRRIITTGGEVHAVEAMGSGRLPPVVLLHGLGSAGVHYGPLLRRLRPRVRRVVAPDIPAHGLSHRPRGEVDLSVILDGLFEALDALIGSEPAVLFGNSLGGYAAARYAASRPHKLRALVLCSPAGGFTTHHDMERLREVLKVGRHEHALQFVDRVFARPQPILRHAVAWGVKRRLTQPHIQDLVRSVTPAHAVCPRELGSISVPVLLLWGQLDGLLPLRQLDYYLTHLPDHVIVQRPADYGHSPYLEDPADVCERVLSFLESSV